MYWRHNCKRRPKPSSAKNSRCVYGLEFPTRGYPVYETAPNNHWVAGFWPGMLWLAYHATGESELRTKAEALLPSFAKRLEERIDMSHPRDGPPPRHIDIAAAGRRRPG